TSPWAAVGSLVIASASPVPIQVREFALIPSSETSEVEINSVPLAITNPRGIDRRRQTHVPGTGTGIGGDYNRGDPGNR
ncbi:hypothetical protein BGZ46_004651, partial [Entomortierella lignicola]